MRKHLLAGVALLSLVPAVAIAQTTTPAAPSTPATPPASTQMAPTTPMTPPASTQMAPMTPPASGSSTTSTTTTTTPSMSSPSMSSPSMSSSNSMASGPVTYMAAQQETQWMASRLIDRSVYGSDGNTIGDINDVVIDRSGNVAAVVIGVGGFLGIGEKDVAVPFNALHGMAAAASNSNATMGERVDNWWNDDNVRLTINATRADLQNAPTFRPYDARAAARNNAPATPASPSASGTTTTPPAAGTSTTPAR